MAKTAKEDLPTGIERLPSGSLRVKIRVQGHPTTSTTIPLHDDSPQAQAKQLDQAVAWQAATAVKIKSGQHQQNDEAMTLTVGYALTKLRDEQVATLKKIAVKLQRTKLMHY